MILNDTINTEGTRVIEGEVWYELNYHSTEIHYVYTAKVVGNRLKDIHYERLGDDDFSGSWVEDIREDLKTLQIDIPR